MNRHAPRPDRSASLEVFSPSAFSGRVALCGHAGSTRSRFGVGIGPRVPRHEGSMRRPCGFSPPALFKKTGSACDDGELTFERGRDSVFSDAVPERAAAPCRKRLLSRQRTNGYARIVGWPATPSRFVSDRCSPRVMRRGIFSFPSRRSATRGANLRSLAGRGEASDLALRPAALMGFSCSLRRFAPAGG